MKYILTTAVRGKPDQVVAHHELINAIHALESEFSAFLIEGQWVNIQLSDDGKVTKDICLSVADDDAESTEPDPTQVAADLLHVLKRHYPTPTPDAIQILREVADIIESVESVAGVLKLMTEILDTK